MFSKGAVENSVKSFFENNFFMQLFLRFDQKVQTKLKSVKKCLNIPPPSPKAYEVFCGASRQEKPAVPATL